MMASLVSFHYDVIIVKLHQEPPVLTQQYNLNSNISLSSFYYYFNNICQIEQAVLPGDYYYHTFFPLHCLSYCTIISLLLLGC